MEKGKAMPHRWQKNETDLPKNPAKADRIIEILKKDIMAPTKFRTVPRYWWENHQKGEMRLTETIYINLKREIVEIRNLLRECQKMKTAKQIGDALRAEKRIHPFIIVDGHKLYDQLRGKTQPNEQYLKEIKIKLSVAYAALNPE
jgi:hypothetical protein